LTKSSDISENKAKLDWQAFTVYWFDNVNFKLTFP